MRTSKMWTSVNDKITNIVNLQYRKGFEKEWKYYIILSHLI